ncbi:hypothetical protein M758_9G136900 [Ceratodon purpureus]|nr:hypothetical protein M758_9G136900 [Ceratodon purpureus]
MYYKHDLKPSLPRLHSIQNGSEGTDITQPVQAHRSTSITNTSITPELPIQHTERAPAKEWSKVERGISMSSRVPTYRHYFQNQPESAISETKTKEVLSID